MTDESQPQVQILEVAWNLYAQLDALSKKQSRPYYLWYGWISSLGVFAILLAVIIHTFPDNFPAVLNVGLKVLLIAILIAASVLAAFVNKFSHENEGRASREGAEKIQKEIYLYRTFHKDKPDRREWLEGRLNDIQQHVRRGMNRDLVLGQPPVKISPNIDPDNPDGDEGYNDLNGDEYVRDRLETQLAKFIRKVQQYESEQARQQTYILLAGGFGVLFAAIGGSFSIWVAVPTSLMVLLIGWQGLRNLDPVVKNSSRVVTELMAIYDHWNKLEQEERTNDEFFRMVKSTEDVLLRQNIEYIPPVQDVLDEETQEIVEETELKDVILHEAVKTEEVFKDQKPDYEVAIVSKDIEEVLVEETLEEAGMIESIFPEVEETEEVFKDQKPEIDVEITPQPLEDVFAEEIPEEVELLETVIQEADKADEPFKGQIPEHEVSIPSHEIEEVLAEEIPEEVGLIEGIFQEAGETEDGFKDQKLDGEVEIEQLDLEDVIPEETPEEAELTESVLQGVDEADETIKNQKLFDGEVEITQQASEDTLAEETPEEAELIQSVSQEVYDTEEASGDQISDIKVGVSKKALEGIHELPEEVVNEMPGSLAEEASSELVQAELAAMAEATSQTGSYAENIDRFGGSRLSDTLDVIAKEFEDVEIGRDTPASVLNNLLSRYPPTNDVKG